MEKFHRRKRLFSFLLLFCCFYFVTISYLKDLDEVSIMEINRLTVAIPSLVVEAAAPLPEKGVANVVEAAHCPDPLEGNMLYLLDNGMLLEFRGYVDPLWTIGQEISWVKEGQGIRIFYEGGSDYLPGDFEHNCFVRW